FVVCDTVCDDIYSVSLHDALPILLHRVVDVCNAGPCQQKKPRPGGVTGNVSPGQGLEQDGGPSVLIVARRGTSVREEVLIMTRRDRKSTRLNSSHVRRSYAVFCLK